MPLTWRHEHTRIWHTHHARPRSGSRPTIHTRRATTSVHRSAAPKPSVRTPLPFFAGDSNSVLGDCHLESRVVVELKLRNYATHARSHRLLPRYPSIRCHHARHIALHTHSHHRAHAHSHSSIPGTM
ncbi:hypothetical protein M404DRAFT_427525 [Pisolithus tinctorius Marx 270]|uniref:Uncharacterized protein n=1 Tax=Pisolithus tinctorius Marx 270 TaxID=870435 RepID=A0A0C3KBP4_PISTI|nr:hypothetical protein M404DRAFT_427525 [Pisolithus tinctorius Marx 270]